MGVIYMEYILVNMRYYTVPVCMNNLNVYTLSVILAKVIMVNIKCYMGTLYTCTHGCYTREVLYLSVYK